MRLLMIGALALAIPAQASAWGTDAHRAIARIAARRLSAEAARAVSGLLEGQPMADVAMWADDVRQTHRETSRWHFVKIPLASDGRYDRDRDCRQTASGDCVIEALARFEATLGDARASEQERRDALKFVIHLVGDVHQPLHAADNNDTSGTRRRIAPIGRSTTLHSAWDSGIIQASGQNAETLVQAASRWLKSNRVKTGTFAGWAEESFKIAKTIAYPQVDGDDEITATEQADADKIIVKQIAKAGARLAATLNRIYK